MSRRRLHVVYEHGINLSCYCSGQLRLLRPLRHPALAESLMVSADRRFEGGRFDAVIVERLWKPFVTLEETEQLIDDVRRSGSGLLYAQDDNVFDLHLGLDGQDWFTEEHVAIMERLASEADGVLVSTERLSQRMSRYNDRIVVLPNCLDDRLLLRRPHLEPVRPRGGEPLVLGYMGTQNHDQDLASVASALRRVLERHRGKVVFELIGALAHQETRQLLRGLPVRYVSPPADETDYPLFMLWFTRNVRWDLAIAPLRDNAFNVCKSDIKRLDYGAIGAAGIYSRLDPYQGIVSGTEGLVVDNSVEAWVEGLERLILDEELRTRIARGGASYLFAERVLSRRIGDWREAIDRLLD